MEIKNWFCSRGEEWVEFLKTDTIDEAFYAADDDYEELWDLIQWLRRRCD